MVLLSWNVNQFKQEARLPDIIESIGSVGPDIVTLQEVKDSLADCWQKRLAAIGLIHIHQSSEDAPPTAMCGWLERKRHGCLIASRWPVKSSGNRWRRCAPYPELLGRARVSVPDDGEVDVFTAHIPNGEGNGWRKIDTFHVLSAALRRAVDSPRILTGDFNEPKRFRQSGQIVTFGEEVHEDGGTCARGWWSKFGDKRRNIQWRNGVISVLGGTSQHGLRDAYRDLHGFETPTPVTHYAAHKYPRCFDHTFVSRHFNVWACGYFHEWRKPRLSDHSPMWAILHRRTDLPRLERWADDCS